jgi:hypothetical protein
MQVMLQLQRDAARMLRHHIHNSAASAELVNKAHTLGVTLRPLRARSEDSPAASGFTVEVPDRVTADRVIRELRDCDGVEAAYFVPSDELP